VLFAALSKVVTADTFELRVHSLRFQCFSNAKPIFRLNNLDPFRFTIRR
jgi:hypothetical protein